MAITGTSRGAQTNNTSGTTLYLSSSSNCTTGSFIVLCIAYDNSGTNGADSYSSIADSKGNTWTPRLNALNDPGAANAGTVLRVFTTSQDVAPLQTSSRVTMSFSTAVTAKACTFTEFSSSNSGGSGYLAYVTGTYSVPAATTSPTITSVSVGYLDQSDILLGVVGREANTTRTDDSDTTNGSWSTSQKTGIGTTTSGQEIITQYKIPNAAGTQTYNPTFGTSADLCIAWVWIKERINFTDEISVLQYGVTGSALDTWVSNTNLIAYFDSTQLDSYPGSGSKWTDLKTGYTASLVNSPTFTDNSLIFNGTTQYANFENSLLNVFNSGSHTVEMWVRPGTLVTNKYLVSARSTTDSDRSFFQIATSTTGYSYVHTYGEATYSASTVEKCYSTDTWYHVVGTRYRNTSSLYVNGIKGAAFTYRTGDFRSVDRLLAMAGVEGSTTVVNYLSGALGVVRFYDNALTHDEIVQNYKYLRFRYNN